MTEIPNALMLLLILLLSGLYAHASWGLLSALKQDAIPLHYWWPVLGLCLCALFLIMAVFNLPLPLFFLLLYGLKICELLHFPDTDRQNWAAVNESFLYTCAACLVLIGLLSFALGMNVQALLANPLLRTTCLAALLLCNLITELFLSRHAEALAVFKDIYGSEESRLFIQFTFLGVVFVLADAGACLFDLPTTVVSLFLVGSNALLLMMVGFFMNQISIINQENYLEHEHTLLTSTMQQQTARTEALKDTAYRDPLTGAYTRLYIFDYLALFRSRGEAFALAYIDLDGLKAINDSFGHLAGDQYLKAFSSRFSENLNREDVFARIGGDEFMVLFPGITAGAARARLLTIRRRLEAARCENWSLSFSFGVSEAPTGTSKPREALIREADLSMYEDKSARRKKEVQA